MHQRSFQLAELAEKIGAELNGDGTKIISGISPLDTANTSDISFLHNSRYRHFLKTTNAAAVIISSDDVQYCKTNALIVVNPYLAFAKSAALFAYNPVYPIGIHSSAIIGKNCQIDPTASIGAHCVIGDQVTIEKGAVLEANVVLGDRVSIGENSHLWPQVSVYYGVKIGARVYIHSGAVIGSDGFGLARDEHQWVKIPQIGGVVIENDVEIGANTTIDRGALGDTVIEEGVKLDNQIQIAHNVRIGAHTAIAGCVAVAGSTTVGRFCMIGGGSALAGHIKIADKVVIAGMGMITKSIEEPGVYASGTGFQKIRDWKKSVIRFHQLDPLARRIKALEEKYAKLLASKDEAIKET